MSTHRPGWTPELAAHVAGLPKAELHVHLEGALRPATLLDLDRRDGGRFTGLDERWLAERFRFRDFRHFADLYSTCTDVFRGPADFARAVVELAEDLAPQGVRYAEVTCSAITHHRDRGLPFDEIVDGLWAGACQALDGSGVVVRFVLDHVRDLSAEDCLRTAEWCVRGRGRGVVALGLGGYEPGRPASLFAEAVRWAAERGVPFVPHAGEAAGAGAVRDALRFDPPRLGHGFRAAEDPAVVDALLDRGVVLEVCPTGNLRTGVVADLAEHPVRRLRDRGVRVVLGSDDPLLFGSTALTEYRQAYEHLGFSADDLAATARESLGAALPDGVPGVVRVPGDDWPPAAHGTPGDKGVATSRPTGAPPVGGIATGQSR
ncbi:adenosine deaminase [Saccharothrix obliqua]|uniref:adenosine deaminase n=1 Tax=Saccharothrix obliqua TaxID=2861747 RepID=UPI001C5F3E06|nr:adenosine deaminase [Saccharothrix obliqua]MBW4722492.1 adenosine deaminase [Saccharothrix obliqua]